MSWRSDQMYSHRAELYARSLEQLDLLSKAYYKLRLHLVMGAERTAVTGRKSEG